MGQIFLISDSHFNHTNIIKYCDRPFKDAIHMNESLVNDWNSAVGPDDTVYHIGDVLMGKLEDGQAYLSRLNGTIHLVSGNHDIKALRRDWFRARFASIQEELVIAHQDKSFYFRHYFSAELGQEQAYYCHGHSHSKGGRFDPSRSFDVGTDSALHILGSCRPFLIDQVVDIIEGRTLVPPELATAQPAS